jgi:hypothetical protein
MQSHLAVPIVPFRQDMVLLHDNVTAAFGYIPKIFVVHRGHHFDDQDWYEPEATPPLPLVMYNSQGQDSWIKQYSLKWKCNKPGKSFVVNGAQFEQACKLLQTQNREK